MKTRFIFASRASGIYNAVSSKYILPTLEKLPGLNLLGQKTDDEIAAKVEELYNLRVQTRSGTEVLTAQVRIFTLLLGVWTPFRYLINLTTPQMHTNLKESLEELIGASAMSFEEIT